MTKLGIPQTHQTPKTKGVFTSPVAILGGILQTIAQDSLPFYGEAPSPTDDWTTMPNEHPSFKTKAAWNQHKKGNKHTNDQRACTN